MNNTVGLRWNPQGWKVTLHGASGEDGFTPAQGATLDFFAENEATLFTLVCVQLRDWIEAA